MSLDTQSFDNYNDWLTYASCWLTTRGLHVHPICIDSKGRLCAKGSGFMRAKNENTFPIKWYWPEQAENLVLNETFHNSINLKIFQIEHFYIYKSIEPALIFAPASVKFPIFKMIRKFKSWAEPTLNSYIFQNIYTKSEYLFTSNKDEDILAGFHSYSLLDMEFEEYKIYRDQNDIRYKGTNNLEVLIRLSDITLCNKESLIKGGYLLVKD